MTNGAFEDLVDLLVSLFPSLDAMEFMGQLRRGVVTEYD